MTAGDVGGNGRFECRAESLPDVDENSDSEKFTSWTHQLAVPEEAVATALLRAASSALFNTVSEVASPLTTAYSSGV